MSDRDSWTDPLSDVPEPVAKKKMSGCLFTSLIVAGLGLVGMLLCCGAGIWALFLFAPKNTKQPAEVTEVGRQVLNLEIIDGFSPDEATTMDNALFTSRIAQFKHREGKGEILISTVKFNYGDPKSKTEQVRQFRKPLEDLFRAKRTVNKMDTHDLTIVGQKATVSIEDVTDPATGKTGHIASVEFEQPSGQTLVLIRMDDDIWDQDAVLKMLEQAKPQ